MIDNELRVELYEIKEAIARIEEGLKNLAELRHEKRISVLERWKAGAAAIIGGLVLLTGWLLRFVP